MSLLEQMKMSPAQATEMYIKLRDTKKAKGRRAQRVTQEDRRRHGQTRRRAA